MRQKIWTANDLRNASASTSGGEAVPSPTAGGEAVPSPTAGGEAVTSPIYAGGEAVTSPAFAGGEAVPSDRRLKDDIVRIGSTNHGLPLYRFRYKGGSDSFAGVMAQDVLGIVPEAVTTGADGFYRVNYGMLGVPFRRLG